MLIKLTAFNALDPRADGDVVEIESTQIGSITSSHTGDGHDYTSIEVGMSLFMVKESVEEVNDKLNEKA